jgi:uncharacterized protein (TIRG00374 family)
LQVILGIVITILAFYFALRDVDILEVWEVVRSANLWFVLLALVGLVIQNILKSTRWRIILQNPEINPNWSTVFSALMVGQLLNYIFPARAGDISRGYIVGNDGAGKSYTYGTIVFEKVIDLTIYVFYFGVLFISMPLPGWMSRPITVTLAVTIVLIALTFLFSDNRGRLVNLLERLTRWLPERIHEWGFKQVRSAVVSFNIIQDRKRMFQILILGLVIWGLTIPIHQFTLLAIDLDLPWTAGLLVWIVLQVGISLPATPGRFGVFEYACMIALGVFGVSELAGVSFGFLLHGIVLFSTLILGLVGFLYLSAVKQSKASTGDMVN